MRMAIVITGLMTILVCFIYNKVARYIFREWFIDVDTGVSVNLLSHCK
jgi:hypothetical protein